MWVRTSQAEGSGKAVSFSFTSFLLPGLCFCPPQDMLLLASLPQLRATPKLGSCTQWGMWRRHLNPPPGPFCFSRPPSWSPQAPAVSGILALHPSQQQGPLSPGGNQKSQVQNADEVGSSRRIPVESEPLEKEYQGPGSPGSPGWGAVQERMDLK